MNDVLFKTKSLIEFNRFYVIESLGEDDKKTGTLLCQNLVPITDSLKCITTGVITVENRKSFLDAFDFLKKEAENGNTPIVHFEIHGLNDKSGLILSNGDVVCWQELLELLSELNHLTHCNLMATFAVCYGLNIFNFVSVTNRMPFCYTIGSYREMYEYNIMVSFEAFYENFFRTLDIDSSYNALKDANPGLPDEFVAIKADILFAYVHKRFYEKMECKETAYDFAKTNVEELSNYYSNPEEKENLIRNFIEEEKSTREDKYMSHIQSYYNMDEDPENWSRFWIIDTAKDLLEFEGL